MPVYKYRDGWAYKINIKKKQIFRSGFKTKKEAQMSEYSMLLKLDVKEKKITYPKITDVDEIFKEYLNNEFKVTSSYIYYVLYKNHIFPFVRTEYVNEISNYHLLKFIKYVTRLKYKDKNKLFRLMKLYLEFLTDYGLKDVNLNLLKMPKASYNESKKMKFYTYEEFLKYQQVIHDPLYLLLFNMLFFYGVRIGEIRGLQHQDFNFKTNTLLIRRSLTNKVASGQRTVINPKTSSSIREFPILDNIKRIYKEIFKNSLKTDFVFKMGETTISRRNEEYAEASGLKRIRIHDFRHSCASFLINNGMDYLQVSAWLGHKSPTTTLNTYSHLFPSRKTAIATFINDLKSY